MRTSSLVLALMLSPLVLRPAPAELTSEHLDDFVVEIERLAAELDVTDPDQKLRKKFLKKMAKAVARKSKSLATDAAVAAKLAKLLEKAGTDLAELQDELALAFESFGDNVDGLISNLEFRVGELPDSDLKTKAQKKLAQIRDLIADVDPADLVALGKAYKKALLKRRSAAKIVGKAEKKAGFE